MCLRSSSVPKFSTWISTNWPQLRPTAWRHIFSRSYGNPKRVKGLRMWTARHIDGSLQRLCHGEHTICALVRISNASKSHQDRRRHVPGQSQPVGEFVCRVRRRVHREIFSVRGIRHGKRSSAMSDFEEERKKIREVRFQSENTKSQP
jgi:hypothetical protein